MPRSPKVHFATLNAPYAAEIRGSKDICLYYGNDQTGVNMAITDTRAVLILGAGVSAPFNVPLGGQMIDAVRRQILEERPDLRSTAERKGMSFAVGKAFSSAPDFWKYPIHASVGLVSENISGNSFIPDRFEASMRKIEDLVSRLDGQTSETIDDFIVQNESLAQVAKIAVAAILFCRSYCLDEHGRSLIPRPLHRRFCGHLFDQHDLLKRPELDQRNWIHHLINIVRNHRRLRPDDKHKVEIISFNYDTILEHVLDAQFTNTDAQHGNWRDFIRVLHIHGACGPINVIRGERPDEIVREWAAGIHVVNDKSTPSEQVLRDRKTAEALIYSATQIHCAGFSFADSNVELLGLDKKRGGTMNFCNYDANVGVKMSAEKCGAKARSKAELDIDGRSRLKVTENANSDRRPLEVADWFKIGYAGPLPG